MYAQAKSRVQLRSGAHKMQMHAWSPQGVRGGACDEQTSACLLFWGRANYSSLTWLVSWNNVWATHSQAAARRARLDTTANHSFL